MVVYADDQVLDDIYQYHLPPTRRVPPLLWTRLRGDLPGYLADSEADGVIVINWYHRQFRLPIELETNAIRRFGLVSIVSYCRPSLMIIASVSQFHVYLP